MVSIDELDLEMLRAIEAARSTIGDFFEAYERPKPGQSGFLIKARFVSGDSVEHIWLADLDFSSNPAKGRGANETSFPGLEYLQMTSFSPEQITDWMFYQNGDLIGAYTTKLLLQRQQQIN
jgi:uncharacterized protein YegJ (DUF2314 family)